MNPEKGHSYLDCILSQLNKTKSWLLLFAGPNKLVFVHMAHEELELAVLLLFVHTVPPALHGFFRLAR